MSDLRKDTFSFSMNPDDYFRAFRKGAVSPQTVKSPLLSNFNPFDGQKPPSTETFSNHDGPDVSCKRRRSSLSSEAPPPSNYQKRALSADVRRRGSSVINGLPSSPFYTPRNDALCDGEYPLIHEENFARSPSSEIVFNSSVIREVIGTRKIYRTNESEYLVHWARYPRGQLSWVSQDMIQPIAEYQIVIYKYERRLLCYKGPCGEIFTRKDAPQCEEGNEEGCIGCARCGRGCN